MGECAMKFKINWKCPDTKKWITDTVEAKDIKEASRAAIRLADGEAGGSFTVVST
jgi:hypothetical protein